MKTLAVLFALCLTVSATKTHDKFRTNVEEQVKNIQNVIAELQANPIPAEHKQTCTGNTFSWQGGCVPCFPFCDTACPASMPDTAAPFYCESCSSVPGSLSQIFAFVKFVNQESDNAGICIPCGLGDCVDGCPEKIVNNQDYCTGCFEGRYLYKQSASATVGRCERCEQGCTTECPTSRTSRGSYCTACGAGYRFQESTGGVGYCETCDKGCLDACPATSGRYCTQCDSDHYLHFYSSSSTTGQCQLCDVNCEQSCPTNHTGSENYCTSCREGYYLALDSGSNTGRCKKCLAHCATTCPSSVPSSQDGKYCTECAGNGGDLFELLLGGSFNNINLGGDDDEVSYIDCISVDCANALDNVYSDCIVTENGFICPVANPNGVCCGGLRTFIADECDDGNNERTDDDDDLDDIDPCTVQAPDITEYANIRCADTASVAGTTRITGNFALTDLGSAFRLAFAIICARDLGIPVDNFLVTSVVQSSTKQSSFDVSYSVLPTDDVPIANITANLVDPTFLTAEALTTQLAAEGVPLAVTDLATDSSSVTTVESGSTANSLVAGLAIAVSVFVAMFVSS